VWLWKEATDKQFAAIMIAGTVVMIGLICGGLALMSAAFRLWGLM